MKPLYYVELVKRICVFELLLKDAASEFFILPHDNAHDYRGEMVHRGGNTIAVHVNKSVYVGAAGFETHEQAHRALVGDGRWYQRGRYWNLPMYRHHIMSREALEHALHQARIDYTKERLYS